MKTYGAGFNHQGMSDAGGFLPRGSRLRWSGLVSEGFISGYWTESQIRQNLERRGLTVEDIASNYESIGWDAVPLFRLFITVVTPVDWNETDAFSVITNEVKAGAGVAPASIRQEVLFAPYAQTAAGQPIYAQAPNAPGGEAFGAGILDTLSKALGVTQSTAQLILIAGVGLVAITLFKGGRR